MNRLLANAKRNRGQPLSPGGFAPIQLPIYGKHKSEIVLVETLAIKEVVTAVHDSIEETSSFMTGDIVLINQGTKFHHQSFERTELIYRLTDMEPTLQFVLRFDPPILKSASEIQDEDDDEERPSPQATTTQKVAGLNQRLETEQAEERFIATREVYERKAGFVDTCFLYFGMGPFKHDYRYHMLVDDICDLGDELDRMYNTKNGSKSEATCSGGLQDWEEEHSESEEYNPDIVVDLKQSIKSMTERMKGKDAEGFKAEILRMKNEHKTEKEQLEAALETSKEEVKSLTVRNKSMVAERAWLSRSLAQAADGDRDRFRAGLQKTKAGQAASAEAALESDLLRKLQQELKLAKTESESMSRSLVRVTTERDRLRLELQEARAMQAGERGMDMQITEKSLKPMEATLHAMKKWKELGLAKSKRESSAEDGGGRTSTRACVTPGATEEDPKERSRCESTP